LASLVFRLKPDSVKQMPDPAIGGSSTSTATLARFAGDPSTSVGTDIVVLESEQNPALS